MKDKTPVTKELKLNFIDNRFFEPQKVKVDVERYVANKSICIRFITDGGNKDDFQDPWLTATICMPQHDIAADHVFIKDYSENVGVDSLMIENGIIESEPVDIIDGFPVFRLTSAMKSHILTLPKFAGEVFEGDAPEMSQ